MSHLPNRPVRAAFEIVELLAGSPDGLTAARLCAATGLSRTAVHSALDTLVGLDIVCHDERYHLSVQWQRRVTDGPSRAWRARR